MKSFSIFMFCMSLFSASAQASLSHDDAVAASEDFVSEDGSLGIWIIPGWLFGGCTDADCVIAESRNLAKQQIDRYRQDARGSIFEIERSEFNAFIMRYCHAKNTHVDNPEVYLFDSFSRENGCANWMIVNDS